MVLAILKALKNVMRYAINLFPLKRHDFNGELGSVKASINCICMRYDSCSHKSALIALH